MWRRRGRQGVVNTMGFYKVDHLGVVAYRASDPGSPIVPYPTSMIAAEARYEVIDAPFQVDLKTGLRDEEDSQDQRNEMRRSYAIFVLKACETLGRKFVITKAS